MKRLVIAVAIIGATFALGATAKAAIDYSNSPAEHTRTVQLTTPPTSTELLKLVNAERTKAGVPSLKENKYLDHSAQRKAADETKYNYYDHVSPHDKRHGYTYVFDEPLKCDYASENLQSVETGNTSKEVVASWMNSKPHRTAMLNKQYTITGFGITRNQVVEHFC